MTIIATTTLGDGLYVPFRTGRRGGRTGGQPVGTVFVDAEVTGDATGGTANARLTHRKDEFGFHPIIMPVMIGIFDNLAAAEEVLVQYFAAGNARISTDVGNIQTTIRHDSAGNNAVLADIPALGVETEEPTAQNFLGCQWETNTDTKVYHLHLYAYVFDAELIAKGDGEIGGLLGGIT